MVVKKNKVGEQGRRLIADQASDLSMAHCLALIAEGREFVLRLEDLLNRILAVARCEIENVPIATVAVRVLHTQNINFSEA